MDLKTAAEYVSLSPRTLQEYIEKGRAPFDWARLPLGNGQYVRKRLIAKSDLDRWVDEAKNLAPENKHAIVEKLIKCL
jgi:hypothetical protein